MRDLIPLHLHRLKLARLIQLRLIKDPLSGRLPLDLLDQALDEFLIGAHERDGIPPQSPSRIAPYFDALHGNPLLQGGQELCDITLHERRRDQHTGRLPLVIQPLVAQEDSLQPLQQLHKEPRNAREDMDVVVDDRDGHPLVVRDVDDLRFRPRRQHSHAHASRQRGRRGVPIERRSIGSRVRHPTHARSGLLVQFQWGIESRGERGVGNVIVRLFAQPPPTSQISRVPPHPPARVRASSAEGNERNRTNRTDPPRSYDEIVVCGHAPRRINDLALLVGDHLDTLQLDAEVKTVLGKVGGVRVDSLLLRVSSSAAAPSLNASTHLAVQHLIANDETRRGPDRPVEWVRHSVES